MVTFTEKSAQIRLPVAEKVGFDHKMMLVRSLKGRHNSSSLKIKSDQIWKEKLAIVKIKRPVSALQKGNNL